MAAKACVACNKLIAASFQKCSFCGAEQPPADAPAAKEARCATCKRPYAAKLEECPFCSRDRAAGVTPAVFGATRTRGSLRPLGLEAAPPDDDDDGEPRMLSSTVLFGAPLLLGALWGIAELLWTNILGGKEASAALGPSVVVALFVAPALAALFVRRTYRTLGAALDDVGLSKVLVIGFVASAVAIAPATLSVTGFIHWFNRLGADARARVIECKVGSVWHTVRNGADTGWQMTYACDVDGEHLSGRIGPLATRPQVVEGGTVSFRAARGRFGYWVRFGEPIAPAPAP